MDKLYINFVSQAGTHLASHRMRVMKPAELLNVGVENINTTINSTAMPQANVNVFNKHFDTQKNLQSVLSAEQLGYKTIMDVCDDHFDREHGEYYERMCEAADHIICNTPAMQERIYEVVGRTARIVPDPITFPKMDYKPVIDGNPKFLWFGHSSNATPLLEWLTHIPTEVTCVCNGIINHPKVRSISWSPYKVESMISNYDFVLIPTTKEAWAKCKSPNRAVDAIQAGKIVITDSEEIYGCLRDFIYIIENPKDIQGVIEEVTQNPDKAKRKITEGQKFIKENYSDDVILDEWLKALQELELVKEFKCL